MLATPIRCCNGPSLIAAEPGALPGERECDRETGELDRACERETGELDRDEERDDRRRRGL